MKKQSTLVIIGLFLVTLLFLLSACNAPEDLTIAKTTPVIDPPDPDPVSPTLSPSLTATELPTLTSTPLPTAEKSSTATATATTTPTATPTKFSGFENARVYKAYADFEGTVFYFIVVGVESPYFGTVDGHDLTCEPDPNKVNLLVCNTNANLFGTSLKAFEFFADEAHTYQVYAGSFVTGLDIIPLTPTPVGFIWPRADYLPADITWGYNPPDCPVRGINLSCEIEYRRYEDNSCLVGMSCYDSCGFYYSVDTIKDKSGEWESSGPCW